MELDDNSYLLSKRYVIDNLLKSIVMNYKIIPICFLMMFITYPIYKYKEIKRKERIELLAKNEQKDLPFNPLAEIEKTEDVIFSAYYLREKEDIGNKYVVHFSANNPDSIVIHSLENNLYSTVGAENIEKLFAR